MKDRQPQTAGPQSRIPILSALLHWLALPVIMFLRRQFGFSFLSPKSVFLAFGWAAVLFFIYAAMERGAWARFWAVACFALGATILYTFHLLRAFLSETRRQGEHDFFAGHSNLPRLLRQPFSDLSVHLWLEPALVAGGALLLRTLSHERYLSTWLLLVAPAMVVKAFLNYWYPLRYEKREKDTFDDAVTKMDVHSPDTNVPLPSSKGRKPKARPTSSE